MKIKELLSQISPFQQCRRYRVGLWQCPNFLWMVMGAVTMTIMSATYLIASRYAEEEVVVISVTVVTLVLFTIGYAIIQSFERLAEMSRIKTEFISVVTHQLRTPLSSLKWSLDLIMSERVGKLEKEQLKFLKIIEESNERMIKLVNDLLEVNRIEEKEIKMKLEEFSLVEVTKSVVENLTPLAEASNVSLKFSSQPNLPQVEADREKIGLVIQNLVDNAIKYTKGKGEVKIELSRQGVFLKLSVKDKGVGIPEHQQKQVFQKFFRSDNIMKHQTIGTGLGLFIAKGIVEQSGGKMGFKSKEGKGSTFWFTLPIK